MSKIGLIITREYLTRVRKKSFIIMTLLSPLLFAGIMIAPTLLAVITHKESTVMVSDESGFFNGKLKNSKDITYSYSASENSTVLKEKVGGDFSALLTIPKEFDPVKAEGITVYSQNALGFEEQMSIESALSEVVTNYKLGQAGVKPEVVEQADTDISIATKVLAEEGEKDSSSGAATIFGYLFGFMIYMFIFLYGVQVMRGVIEEKTNRIVEVIISSVKPFELMMGKVVGIACVGLTQFVLWVLLTVLISSVGSIAMGPMMEKAAKTKTEQVTQAMGPEAGDSIEKANNNPMGTVMKAVSTINLPLVLGCFGLYFLGGYLLYASLFAAVGAAVDNETDSQQFMTPISLPLLAAIIAANMAIKDPNGGVAFWMSMIPFTSPVMMMLRVPFNPPLWEIALSLVLLFGAFVLNIWVAGRIYRVGILMYGKKPTYKELGKWLFYKE